MIGLAAALLMGWLWHGPGGQGERLIGQIEAQVKEAVAVSRLPGATVRLERDPLSRKAILSGNANDLQREGLGSQWGAKDYARAIPGVAAVRWDDEADAFQLPLLAETLILVTMFYLAGSGLGLLFFRRRRRTSFLD
jgi:hypothetical protein